MYVYQDALCLIRNMGLQWERRDIDQYTLTQLYSQFEQTFIVVLDVHENRNVNIPMEAYRTKYACSPLTVFQWLESMKDLPVVTVDILPDTDLVSARYENAILRNYKISPVKAGYQYPEDMPTTELPDLALHRDLTDMSKLHTHCLLSVNGYYHRSDSDGTDAFILDGNVTAMKKRCSHTGILSFLDIGEITLYQLKDEDVIPLNEDGKLADGLIIRLPEGYEEKSKLFIFGGYILQPDAVAFVNNGPGSYILYPKALPLLERYFESRDELDLSSIIVETPLDSKENAILRQGIYSDSNIRAWLKLSQSFVAIIDTPQLYYSHINVRVSKLPGFVTAYQEPRHPLIMGYGKHIEYSKTEETRFWALRIQDPYYKQFNFQKAPIRTLPVVTDQYIPWRPYARTQGYLLNISGPKKKYD